MYDTITDPLLSVSEPRSCEMYDIRDDGGTRRLRIRGWLRRDGNAWRLTVPRGVDVPLAAFTAGLAADGNYVERLWEGAALSDTPCTADEALHLARTFFGGAAPERNVRYRDVTDDMPCGNYMHCETLPPS